MSDAPPAPARRLSSRAFWGFASWALPLGVVFVVSPRLLHAIGPDRFGVLMIALVTPLIASQLEFGLSSAAVRRFAARLSKGPIDAGTTLFTLQSALTAIGLVFGAVLWIAAAPVSARLGVDTALGAEEGRALVRACAIWVALALATLLPGIIARAAQALALIAAVQTSFTVLLWVGALVCLERGAPLVAVIWFGIELGLAAAAITLIATRRRIAWNGPIVFSVPVLTGDARFSAGMFAAQAAGALVYQGDRMLVAALGSPAMAGLYALCTNVANKSVAAVAALTSFVFPHAAVLHSAGLSARLNGLVHALDRAIAVLLVPVLLPGLFLAEPFLRLWLGSYGTPELALAFRILLIAFVLPAFAMPISSVLVASGNSRLPARFAWLTVVVALGSMLWLVPRHGLAGAALGMLLGNATSLWFSWQARRALAVPPAADRMPFWGGLLLGCTAQALLLVVVAAAALSWGRLLLAAASAWALFYVVRAIFKRLAPEELQLLSRARSAARR